MIRLRSCLLVAVSALGCASPADTSNNSAPETSTAAAFTDVTAQSGLAGFSHVTGAAGAKWLPETMGGGVAFVDFNGDGMDDVALIGGGAWTPAEAGAVSGLQLFENAGGGAFSSATADWLPAIEGYAFGIIASDYDNDGDQDLFVSMLGPNVLLRNEGDRFLDVTMDSGLDPGNAWSTAGAFFDADGDGNLDLLVGNYVEWSPETDIFCSLDGERKGYCTPELYPGEPLSFFRNLGEGRFADAAEAAGFADSRGKTLGLTVVDYNRDGRPDVAVANDSEPDEIFENLGDGVFREIGVISGMAFDERGRARAGMGIDAGVLDETGNESIVVGNFAGEMLGVYRYIGNDVFLDRAAASRIGRPSLLTLTFGLVLLDADLDGDLDLAAANGHIEADVERVSDTVRFRQVPHLFLNSGDGAFVEAAGSDSYLSEPLLGRGLAYSDIDGDGDPDLLFTQNGEGVRLYRNESAGNRGGLAVDLEGVESNRDGIGARIELVVRGGRQFRMVRSGGSYLSQSSLTALFGLGSADAADSLQVYWPSGQVDRFGSIASGQVRIREGSGEAIRVR